MKTYSAGASRHFARGHAFLSHRDLALASIGSVEAQNILNTAFANQHSVKPTLLFAYDDSFRALTYSPEAETSGGMTWSGSNLSVDLNGTVPETVSGVNLAPYAYNGSAWAPMELQAYWTELDARYANTETRTTRPRARRAK